MSVVREAVRLCRATVYPCRAKLRARLRPITPRPVTPICAVACAMCCGSALRELAHRRGPGPDNAGEDVRVLAPDHPPGRGVRLRQPHSGEYLPRRPAR